MARSTLFAESARTADCARWSAMVRTDFDEGTGAALVVAAFEGAIALEPRRVLGESATAGAVVRTGQSGERGGAYDVQAGLTAAAAGEMRP